MNENYPQPVEAEPRLTTEQLLAEAQYAWLGHVGANNVEAARDTFVDQYLGYYATQLAFAQELLTVQDVYQTIEDLHAGLPERVRRYLTFDEEAYAESLVDQYYFAPSLDRGVHVFKDD